MDEYYINQQKMQYRNFSKKVDIVALYIKNHFFWKKAIMVYLALFLCILANIHFYSLFSCNKLDLSPVLFCISA